MERTLVILKPDAVQRSYVGNIIARFENKGLKLVAMKLIQLSDTLLAQHYSDHVNKPFYPGLCEFMKSGPVVLMVLEGNEAISVVRQLMGPTNAAEAPAGTIRGDLAITKGFNLVHGSDSAEAAQKEQKLFFKDEEILSYDRDGDRWLLPN